MSLVSDKDLPLSEETKEEVLKLVEEGVGNESDEEEEREKVDWFRWFTSQCACDNDNIEYAIPLHNLETVLFPEERSELGNKVAVFFNFV